MSSSRLGEKLPAPLDLGRPKSAWPSGGNSRFAGGVMRFAFDGVDDLRKVADLTDEEVAGADFGTYTRSQYFDDLFRLTQYRTDPMLVEMLVTRSLDTMIWLRSQGARFVPIYGRQA